jgi:hypothetical protein
MSNELTAMQEQFPDFVLWSGSGGGRMLYLSRARRPVLNLHRDPGELGEILHRETEPGSADSPAAAASPYEPPALPSALAAARELLASTADTVNPGVPAATLLEHLCRYRARLAALVAAQAEPQPGI